MMEKTVTKKNNELREITSAVLVPGVCDWHEETYTEEEVLKAERNFSKYCKKANLQHEHQLDETMAEFTESYILPSDMIHEGRVVKKGTWLATMKVKSDALWDAVKDGTFKGFSIGCKVRVEQIIAKSKGNYEGDLDKRATKRLSDFNFKDDFAHIALVTEGANGSDILVMKAKEQEQQTPNEPKTKDSKESVKNKDDNMSEVTYTKEEIEAMKAREIKLQEEVEAMKTKADADALLAEEIEAMKAKETEMAEELEAFKAKEVEALKAKEDAEKEAFVVKAKEMVGICAEDKAEEFGADMFLIKSLAPEAFDRVMEKLDAAEARMKKIEIVEKSPGSTEGGSADLEGEELIEFKAKALMAEDSKLKPAQARIQVRKKMRHDAARA
jgi:hypothetical protein